MDNRNSIERLKSIQLSLSELSNSLEETYFKMRQEMLMEWIKDRKIYLKMQQRDVDFIDERTISFALRRRKWRKFTVKDT